VEVKIKKIDGDADCPKCKARITELLFECPHCGKKFCGNCFIADKKSNGTTIKCPHHGCGKQLFLPTQPSIPIKK
jgi:hypothetical protein